MKRILLLLILLVIPHVTLAKRQKNSDARLTFSDIQGKWCAQDAILFLTSEKSFTVVQPLGSAPRTYSVFKWEFDSLNITMYLTADKGIKTLMEFMYYDFDRTESEIELDQMVPPVKEGGEEGVREFHKCMN